MNKRKDFFNNVTGSRSFYVTLIICLLVFFGAIAMLITAFNRLISRHDQQLSGEICTLISEKMNNSIQSMTSTTKNIAEVLSAQDFSSPDEIYEKLKSMRNTEYISIGFIDTDDRLYATDEEAAEFVKWHLYDTADKADPVSISAPYRSSVFGQPIITMYSNFKYDGTKQGSMFTTYMLSDLQKIAATESLVNDIEIYLMNAQSANIIQCVGTDEHATGSWANAYLSMQNINKEDRDTYNEWLQQVHNGENNIGISYSIGETFYSQYCSEIQSMPGWYVVVRIPSNALSATMSTFRNYVLIFLAILLIVVVVLIINMYRLSKQENRMLEQLSIHDPLTQALNRRAFDFASEQRINNSNKDAALLFFDIDYFKQVNDHFGHDAGDQLLVAFCNVLRKNFEEHGIVSRFGGDEFVVLVDMESRESIDKILEQVAEDAHNITLTDKSNEGSFMISFSSGASRFPHDANNMPDLKKCADMALYFVKERGRNGYLWYDPALKARLNSK